MSVRVTKLPSGMTVVTHAMDHLESASLGIWVGVGSRAEQDGEHGISHLLEHMAFKGTATRTALGIAEEIEAVGGEVNAATGLESTSYYARVLKNDVPLAFDILSDILRNSVFDPTELSREQHVIVQEIGAALDTPDDHVFDLFNDAAYPDQPVGRTILGTPETVRAIRAPTIRSFLERHYRGPSMIVSAAGAVDHDAIVGMVERGFDGIATTPGPEPIRARYKGGDQRQARDTMETQVVLGFEGRPHTSPDYFTAQLLSAVLGGGMSSRLFQEVREKRGLCYSIYAFHWSLNDSGVFGVHAATGPDDVKQLMEVVTSELMRAADDITDAELDRARAQIRAGLLMILESPSARAGQIARQIAIYGRIIPLQELVATIDAIPLRAVRDLAGALITGSAPTIAAVGPSKGLVQAEVLAERLGGRVPA
jgi:predicted Zn-dependent peptidase